MCFNFQNGGLQTTLIMHSRSKKNPLIYFNASYRTEMKLVPIIMDYCLLQFDASKFFLTVGFQPNIIFFNVNPQIFQQKSIAHLSNYLETTFHFSNISYRVIRRRSYS